MNLCQNTMIPPLKNNFWTACCWIPTYFKVDASHSTFIKVRVMAKFTKSKTKAQRLQIPFPESSLIPGKKGPDLGTLIRRTSLAQHQPCPSQKTSRCPHTEASRGPLQNTPRYPGPSAPSQALPETLTSVLPWVGGEAVHSCPRAAICGLCSCRL